MTPSAPSPRLDLERIWTAALAAVEPRRLVAALPDGVIAPSARGRIAVVGGGKAAAGIALGIADRLRRDAVAPERICGLVSVPEGVPDEAPTTARGAPPRAGQRRTGPTSMPPAHRRPAPGIEIRATRPAAANQPTAAVVAATAEMLHLLATLGRDDLAIAVITGGGSALLEQPAEGLELSDVVAVTDALSRAGAGIEALNTVRRAVSRVKAGGLARACGAGRMVVLVLSDVAGDPLDFIASGPCMPTGADPAAARAVLEHFAVGAEIAPRLSAHLARAAAVPGAERAGPDWTTPGGCHVSHVIVGHNATAVAAARAAAEDLGYRLLPPVEPGEPNAAAEAIGIRLARAGGELARQVAHDGRPRGAIEGGEATVRVPGDHGRGGRNQQTVLAALAFAAAPGPTDTAPGWPPGMALASLGTDGEDGPTDAAGALADAEVAALAAADPVAVRRALSRCDAYPLLARCGGLIRTGPTGTNVADLRIVLARPPADDRARHGTARS